MIGFMLLLAVTIALAVISCLGNAESAYTSLPMITAWGATACTAFYYILKKKLFRRPDVFILHCAFIVILAGSFITHLSATSQTLHLRIGQTEKVGNADVRLDEFEVVNYPGTMAPADFVSTLTIDGHTATVAMNKVFTYQGYRFFQTAYDPDKNGSVLTVTHDPAGTLVSYAGYALLMLAMIWCMAKKHLCKRAAIVAMLLTAALCSYANPKVLPAATAHEFGNLLVYHNGRVAPLSTLASDFSRKLTGSTSYRGLTPEQVLTGWIFFYDSWKNEHCIKLSDKSTRRLLEIEGKYASLNDFFSPYGDYLTTGTEHSAANEKFGLASTAATGSLWKIFPVALPDSTLQWLSPTDKAPATLDVEKWHFVSHCFNYLAELANKSEWDALNEAVKKIAAYQQHEAGEKLLPSPLQIKAEKIFTKSAPSMWPSLILIIAGLILFFFTSAKASRILAGTGTLWTALLIALNWIASASVPMANGYETMQWMALCACLCGLFLPRRYHSAIPLCAIVAGLAMVVAMLGQRNPQITQVVPVLRSPLLSVHVLAVMLAYAALAVMALCGMAYFMGRKDLVSLSRNMLRPAVFLLAAGIFIGAVWANRSWGRYWGWDPKEVWALITMIIYSLPLHTSTLPKMRSDRFYSGYTIAAFLTVIMTYFGVNFVLGGLHGYA